MAACIDVALCAMPPTKPPYFFVGLAGASFVAANVFNSIRPCSVPTANTGLHGLVGATFFLTILFSRLPSQLLRAPLQLLGADGDSFRFGIFDFKPMYDSLQ